MPTQLGPERFGQSEGAMPGSRGWMWMWMWLLLDAGSNILFNLKHYRKFSGNYALVQMPHIHIRICIVQSVTTHVSASTQNQNNINFTVKVLHYKMDTYLDLLSFSPYNIILSFIEIQIVSLLHDTFRSALGIIWLYFSVYKTLFSRPELMLMNCRRLGACDSVACCQQISVNFSQLSSSAPPEGHSHSHSQVEFWHRPLTK